MSALQALAAPTGSNDSAGQIEKAGGITGSVDCTSSAPSPPPSPPCGVNDTVSAGGPTGTGAAHAAKKPVVVAQVKKVFTTPGKHAFLVKLTPAGRKLLRHGKGLKLTSKVVFTPPGGKPVTVVRTFKLKK